MDEEIPLFLCLSYKRTSDNSFFCHDGIVREWLECQNVAMDFSYDSEVWRGVEKKKKKNELKVTTTQFFMFKMAKQLFLVIKRNCITIHIITSFQ